MSRFILVLSLLLVLPSCMAPPKTPVKTPGVTSLGAETPASEKSPQIQDEASSGGVAVGGSGGGTGGGTGSRPETRERTRPSRVPAAKELKREKPSERKPRPFSDFSDMAGYEEVTRLYPAPVTSEGISQGERLYKRYCDSCHGAQGVPNVENASLIVYGMADLRRPEDYKFGAGHRAVFRSIAYGTEGTPMLGYRETLSNTEMWDLTNYILEEMQDKK